MIKDLKKVGTKPQAAGERASRKKTGPTLCRTDIAAIIARETRTSREAGGKALAEVINQIVDTLKQDGAVKIFGLGNFDTIACKARMNRNPQTGKAMELPAHIRVRFKAAKAAKEVING